MLVADVKGDQKVPMWIDEERKFAVMTLKVQ